MIRGLLLILLFTGLGCKSQEKGQVKDTVEVSQMQELTLLVADNYGGSENADFQVIRDMKTLRGFFGRVNRTRKPGLPIPEVDFKKEMLILYCPGQMLNGYTARLVIKENTPEKMLFALEGTKVKQKKESGALIMPFSLYKLPLTEKKIILQKE